MFEGDVRDGQQKLQHRHSPHSRRLEGYLKRICRICSLPLLAIANRNTQTYLNADLRDSDTDDTDGIMLFDDEGKRLQLQHKIRKYLYVTISVEDKLPKVMCGICLKKLESIHSFATMAVKVQEKLSNFVNNEESKCMLQLNNNEPKGLLHTYLTKGVIDTPKDESSTTEEMEVRLDPMLILQYSSVDQTDENVVQGGSINGHYDDKQCLEICRVDQNYEGESLERLDLSRTSPTCDFNEHDSKDNIVNNERDQKRKLSSSEPNDSCLTAYQSVLYEAITSKHVHNCNQCSITFPTALALQSHNWQHIAQSMTNNNLKNDRKSEPHSPFESETDEGESSEEESIQTKSPRSERPLNLRIKQSRPLIGRPYQLPFFPTANSVQSMLLSALNRGIERFCCPICGKRISTKGNLKVHLDTHRPKGKYGCDICGRIFKTQCNLLRHTEYHQGVQFPCIVCGRVYPTNSTLRAHSITHSDLRPHKCPLCDKTFKRNQDLKFHINQHTGARPYQCPYCPKAFASSGNCFSHRKRMHPEEVERDKERAAKIMS